MADDLLTAMTARASDFGIEVDFKKWHPVFYRVITEPGTSLNVRSAPAMLALVTAVLRSGTQVEFLDLIEGWTYIRHAGGVGFVSSKWIERV